jgi:dienelactone hydrolase
MHPRCWIVALLACTASAQGLLPVGFKDVAFANTTGSGSAALAARVHYPALSAGQDAPLRPQAGGYPVVVFLHGFAALGRQYPALGDHFAARGMVTVLGDTAQFDANLQVLDGVALFRALQDANVEPGGFFAGALDMARAGVCGHSMGGGSTVNVLARDPGYRAGFCFAPVFPGAATGSVRAPLGVLHGTGDTIVPWLQGQSLFAAATAYRGQKLFYLMNAQAGHLNVVPFLLLTQVDREVWERSARVAHGFFARHLAGDVGALEEAFGRTARSEARLVSLSAGIEATELWLGGSASIGQRLRFNVLVEPGPAAVLLAAGPASVPTPFGPLLIDPLTLAVLLSGNVGDERLLEREITIPADSALIGALVAFQGIGLGRDGLRLTATAALLTIAP